MVVAAGYGGVEAAPITCAQPTTPGRAASSAATVSMSSVVAAMDATLVVADPDQGIDVAGQSGPALLVAQLLAGHVQRFLEGVPVGQRERAARSVTAGSRRHWVSPWAGAVSSSAPA